jgi:hypothetical protein
MKVLFPSLVFLYVLGASVVSFTLDREAFTITEYDLHVQIEPEQHRLAVRGKTTLRNDSSTPQKIAVLQISSSLDWRSIKTGEKPLLFSSQTFTSDIDHTGALSEAIVTLPEPVVPKASVELEIGYDGVIVLDATRLTRIGTPEGQANSTDWDQISPGFTGVRGAGYVAWYPIATEAANLSESNSLFDVLGRWKKREAGSSIHLEIAITRPSRDSASILFNGLPCAQTSIEQLGLGQHVEADCQHQALRWDAPAFLVLDYAAIERVAIEVRYLRGHDVSANAFADSAEKIAPLISAWFGPLRERAKTADLPVADAPPFESGSLLLTPLANIDSKLAGLAAAHQLTHAAFLSSRPWIEEGLAHFSQALYLEHERGRQAALDYMGLHRSAFSEAEKQTALSRSEDETNRALVNTLSDELYRSKGMYVWWMLRDMIGDAPFKKAIAAYRLEQDNDPSYMPRLIQEQTQRDLTWFFDDWVYHDRGLPDFKVTSAFTRKTGDKSYLVTITIENLGGAGAEVPVTVKFAGGDITRRIEVRSKDKTVVRVEILGSPQEIIVNDGSVPESDMTNNVFKIGTMGVAAETEK